MSGPPYALAEKDTKYTFEFTEWEALLIHQALCGWGIELATANYEHPKHHNADMKMIEAYGGIIDKLRARRPG